jgi:hypothetical protein
LEKSSLNQLFLPPFRRVVAFRQGPTYHGRHRRLQLKNLSRRVEL